MAALDARTELGQPRKTERVVIDLSDEELDLPEAHGDVQQQTKSGAEDQEEDLLDDGSSDDSFYSDVIDAGDQPEFETDGMQTMFYSFLSTSDTTHRFRYMHR